MRARRHRLALAVFLVTLAASAGEAPAALTRSVLGNGGGTASGGTIVMRATAGQPAAGRTAGSGRVLGAGYWGGGGAPNVAVEPPGIGSRPPRQFALGSAFPNPSRGVARFRLALPNDAEVALIVYDLAGRARGAERRQRLAAGYHDLVWHQEGVSPGVYFARLLVDGVVRGERRFVQLDR